MPAQAEVKAQSKDTKSTSRTTTAYGKKLPVPSLSSSQYWAYGEKRPSYDEAQLLDIQQELGELFASLTNLKKEKKSLEQHLNQTEELADKEKKKLKDKLVGLEEEIESVERKIDPLLVNRVNLVSETVKHHAQMRVDLFFLLCIALYNKKVDVIKGKTILQHGKGSKELGTAACHASLFPNLYTRNSRLPQQSSWSFFSTIAEMDTSSWLPYYLASVSQKKSVRDERLLLEFGEDSILHGTHFDDVLNLTHELPHIVNSFDCILEGTYQRSDEVKLCLEVLNKVSHGILSPDQGLNRFLEIMDNFFAGMENKFSSMDVKTKESIPYPQAMKRVKELQMEGTFRHSYNKVASKPYIDLLMQLPQSMERYVKDGAGSILKTLYQGPLQRRYKEMQEEIYEHKGSLSIKK